MQYFNIVFLLEDSEFEVGLDNGKTLLEYIHDLQYKLNNSCNKTKCIKKNSIKNNPSQQLNQSDKTKSNRNNLKILKISEIENEAKINGKLLENLTNMELFNYFNKKLNLFDDIILGKLFNLRHLEYLKKEPIDYFVSKDFPNFKIEQIFFLTSKFNQYYNKKKIDSMVIQKEIISITSVNLNPNYINDVLLSEFLIIIENDANVI